METAPINIVSDQIALTASAYTQLPKDQNVRVIYASTEAVYVSIGYATPADATSFMMPAGSSIELKPVPVGDVYVKSVTGAQTIYTYGA